MDRSSSWGGSERAKGMAAVPVSKSQRGDRYANASLCSPSPPPHLQNYEIAIALVFREKQKVLLSSTVKTGGQVLSLI